MGTSRTRSNLEVTKVGTTQALYGLQWNNSTDYGDTSDLTWNPSSLDDTYNVDMTDVVTPDFKRRIGRGEVINNPMSKDEHWYIHPKHQQHTRYQVNKDPVTGKYTGWSAQGGHVVPLSFFGTLLVVNDANEDSQEEITTLVNQAVTQAHANTSLSEMSALSTLAEAKKTVQSMQAIIFRVVQLIRQFRKLNFRYVKKELSRKELADRYMELRYALRPLVYDAKQLGAALGESSAFKTTRATARGYAKTVFKATDSEVINNGDHKYTVAKNLTHTVDIRAGVLCDIKTDHVNVFGLDQPLETLWEITPFSFIFDWFLNIGDTIAAFTPNAGVRQLASWVTVEQHQESSAAVGQFENIPKANFRDEFEWSGTYTHITHNKTRTVNPQLSYFPSVKLRLNTLKLTDLTLIGRALLSRR